MVGPRAAQQKLGGSSQVVVGLREGTQSHCHLKSGAITVEGWIR